MLITENNLHISDDISGLSYFGEVRAEGGEWRVPCVLELSLGPSGVLGGDVKPGAQQC